MHFLLAFRTGDYHPSLDSQLLQIGDAPSGPMLLLFLTPAEDSSPLFGSSVRATIGWEGCCLAGTFGGFFFLEKQRNLNFFSATSSVSPWRAQNTFLCQSAPAARNPRDAQSLGKQLHVASLLKSTGTERPYRSEASCSSFPLMADCALETPHEKLLLLTL